MNQASVALQALIAKIRGSEGLASPPGVALEVMRLARSEDSTVDDFIRIIQNDGALTARILTVVNSSLYGLSRKISSVKQAVVVLGLRAVKVMALSFSLADAVRKCERPNDPFNYPTYWRRALTTAVAARALCRHVSPPLAEDAFVSGLLSDVGIVAGWNCAPDIYGPVLHAGAKSHLALMEAEIAAFGVNHARLSRELLSHWGLPEHLTEVAGAHHGEGIEMLTGQAQQLARVVRLAAQIGALTCRDVDASALDVVREACRSELNISEDQLTEMLQQLDSQVRETAAVLSVKIADGVDLLKLQMDAVRKLAELSAQAESDRIETGAKAKAEVERAHHQAETDGLTGIPNRATFDKRLAAEFAKAQQRHAPLSLLMVDVDHFKRCNDTYGHQTGDEVLKRVAAVLRDTVAREGFVARYGGEEFAIVLAGSTCGDAARLAEQVRKAIEAAAIEAPPHTVRVTASFGLSFIEADRSHADPAAMIEEADRCLYRAKKRGRNRVEFESAHDARGGGSWFSMLGRMFGGGDEATTSARARH